jgi:hypothetical protein
VPNTLKNGLPPVLGLVLEIGVRPFSRPFFPLARTAYKMGWFPFSVVTAFRAVSGGFAR